MDCGYDVEFCVVAVQCLEQVVVVLYLCAFVVGCDDVEVVHVVECEFVRVVCEFYFVVEYEFVECYCWV